MRLHSLAGQHSEALRQYERCRSVLEQELGEVPGDQTEQLRRQIVSRELLPVQEQGTARRGPLFLFAYLMESGEEAQLQEARLREEIAAARGSILGMSGRMICALFAGPRPAVEAAMAAQSGSRPAGDQMRAVLLSGMSHLQEETPSPALVQRARMILEAMHPGQVLLSEAAAKLAGEAKLPEGAATLRPLGAHRLKDLGPAQNLYQLVHPALPQDLPPLKTLDDRPNNLQTQPTPFIGREEELAAVQDALQPQDAQLVTLIGAAGTGKTRLALQAAAALAVYFEQGAFFVRPFRTARTCTGNRGYRRDAGGPGGGRRRPAPAGNLERPS